MFRQIGPPELLIILLIIVLLFGAKKLPETARGLGRSLRIFKAETKGLADDDSPTRATADQPTSPTPAREITAQQTPQAPPAPGEATEPSPTRADEHS